MLEQFRKDCVPWKGPHPGAEKLSGTAERKCYGLIRTSIPHLPALPREGGNEGRKLSLGKKKKKGQGARGVVLIHISYNSVLIDNKLTSPVEPVLLVTATAK